MVNAFQILSGAIHDISDNRSAAVRIAGVPILIIVAMSVFQNYSIDETNPFNVLVILSGLVTAVIGAVIGVGWLRFIILSEQPATRFITWNGRLLWPYTWRLWVLSVVSIFAAIPTAVLAGVLAAFLSKEQISTLDFFERAIAADGSMSWAALLGLILVFWPTSWVFWRLSMWLAMVSTDQIESNTQSSWQRTKPLWRPLIGVSLIIIVLQVIASDVKNIARLMFGITEASGVTEFVLFALTGIFTGCLMLLTVVIIARVHSHSKPADVEDIFG